MNIIYILLLYSKIQSDSVIIVRYVSSIVPVRTWGINFDQRRTQLPSADVKALNII